MIKFSSIMILLFMVLGCSQSYYERRAIMQPKVDDSIITEIIDSGMVKASVKPIDYKWNTDGNLTDLLRKKYKPPQIDYNYPNPFSPPTFIIFSIMKSDSITFYFCNTDESSCFEFEKGFYEKGNYSLGFQKLKIKPGIYTIKGIMQDTVTINKYMIDP